MPVGPVGRSVSCSHSCPLLAGWYGPDNWDHLDWSSWGSDVPPTTYPELEKPILVLESSEFVEFELGPAKFRAPRNKAGFYVGENGDEVDYTTLKAYVPELLQRDSLLTRGDGILISVKCAGTLRMKVCRIAPGPLISTRP